MTHHLRKSRKMQRHVVTDTILPPSKNKLLKNDRKSEREKTICSVNRTHEEDDKKKKIYIGHVELKIILTVSHGTQSCKDQHGNTKRERRPER